MENLNSVLVYQAEWPAFTAEAKGQRLDSAGIVSDGDEAMKELDACETAVGVLEAVFEIGNLRHQLMPGLRRSISVGDVVALCDDDGEVTHYMVDRHGWKTVKCTEHYEKAGDGANAFIVARWVRD